MRIDISLLIRIYKRMKKSPDRVWVASDFSGHVFQIRKYLYTLVHWDIVEIVPVIYKFGNKLQTRKEVIGYKLITKNNLEGKQQAFEEMTQ